VFLNKAAGVEIYSLGMSNLASVGGGEKMLGHVCSDWEAMKTSVTPN